MAKRQNYQDITQGVIWKQLLVFFFPILLGSFFQQMYNTVDTIIVGRAVGTQALAAVGSTASLINLINGFFIGLSTGATVILSQCFGANDRQGVSRALHTGIALSVVLGLLTSAIGIFAGPAVLRLIRTPESCLQDASAYVRIYFSGAVASMIYNMGTGILRAMGDSRKPTLFLITACFVNIFMDILLVVILKMGVAGAALATVFSQCISAALVVITLCRTGDENRLQIRQLRIRRDLLKRILAIGIPAGLQFVTFDFANVLVQSGVNSFGDIVVAGWTAMIKTDSVIWMVMGAFGISVTTFVGQNFGAQKYRRIRQSIWTCMGMGAVTVGLLCALEVIFGEYILGIYTTDPEVIRAGMQVIVYTVPFAVLFVPVEVLGGAMRGTGYSAMPTAITCSCVCLFRVTWLFTVVKIWHTVPMLAVCYPISWLLCASVFFIAYFRGTWLRSRIALCGMEPEVR